MVRYGLLAILLLAGCSSSNHLTVVDRTEVYDQQPMRVFGAVMKAVTASGYPVESADPQSGIVNTGFYQSVKLRATISEENGQTAVTLTLQTNEGASGEEEDPAVMDGPSARREYDRWFSRIRQELQSIPGPSGSRP